MSCQWGNEGAGVVRLGLAGAAGARMGQRSTGYVWSHTQHLLAGGARKMTNCVDGVNKIQLLCSYFWSLHSGILWIIRVYNSHLSSINNISESLLLCYKSHLCIKKDNILLIEGCAYLKWHHSLFIHIHAVSHRRECVDVILNLPSLLVISGVFWTLLYALRQGDGSLLTRRHTALKREGRTAREGISKCVC